MGPSYSVKLTPQPSFFVVVKICAFCKKRARRPKWVVKIKHIERPMLRWRGPRNDQHERMRFRECHDTDVRQTRRRIDSCCSRKHEVVCGRIERTTWSFNKNGTFRQFFLIVFVPATGKRHWATIDNVVRQCPGQIQVGQFVRSKWRLRDQIFKVVSVDKMPDLVGITPTNGGATVFQKREDLKWVSPILALAYMSA